MIASQIKAMPYSDNIICGPTSGSVVCSRPESVKRPSCDFKSLPHCKKRKKLHKWAKCRTREGVKIRTKAKKSIRTKPEAPFNSTQFIMEEHDVLNDSDLSTRRPRRQRDSSLSMDSEELEDDTYLSPEDEEEKQLFLRTQFWNAYEAYNAERLYDMNKSQLVQEYLLLEERMMELEKELEETKEQDRRRLREVSPLDDEEEEEAVPGEVPVDPETAAKIEIFRNEILKLEEENQALEKENEGLRRKHSCRRCANISFELNPLSDSESAVEVEGLLGSSYAFSSGEFSNTEELEISASVLKGSEDVGDDSGIGGSEGAASSASSGEDGREKDDPKIDKGTSV